MNEFRAFLYVGQVLIGGTGPASQMVKCMIACSMSLRPDGGIELGELSYIIPDAKEGGFSIKVSQSGQNEWGDGRYRPVIKRKINGSFFPAFMPGQGWI
jgi:hypothetical protein